MELLFWFVSCAVFVFGIIIGSFLNCWIWRFYAEESPLRGRSYCPKCRHQLAWFDLIPVLSFLAIRGKCRYCQKKISWQYPTVEFATGVLFVAAAWVFYPLVFGGYFSFFPFLELAARWMILAALIVVFVADLRWYLIPDSALVVGFVGALILQAAVMRQNYLVFGQIDLATITAALLPVMFAGLLFLAIFLASRGKWIGFGDVKLAFLMGFILDFYATLIALFLANFFGAIIGLGLICAKKKKMSSQIPFGPFLVAGTLIALFFAPAIADWYLSVGV